MEELETSMVVEEEMEGERERKEEGRVVYSARRRR